MSDEKSRLLTNPVEDPEVDLQDVNKIKDANAKEDDEALQVTLVLAEFNTETIGVGIWATSTIWTTLMGVGVQYAQDHGCSDVAGIYARCVVAFVISLIGCLCMCVDPFGKDPLYMLMQGSVTVGGVIGRVMAYQHLPIGITNLFSGISPILVTAIAAAFLNERISYLVTACYIPAVAGLLLVLQPWNNWGGLDPIGVVVCIIWQFASAVATFLIRWKQLQGGGEKQEHPFVYTAYSFGLTTATMLAYSAIWQDWDWVVHSDWEVLTPYLLWIGVTGLLTQLAVVQGLTMSTVGRATAMRYLSVPLGVLADYVFFGRVITVLQAIGSALVLLSSMSVVFVKDVEKRTESDVTPADPEAAGYGSVSTK